MALRRSHSVKYGSRMIVDVNLEDPEKRNSSQKTNNIDHNTPYPRSTKRAKRGYRNLNSENQKMHMNWWKVEDGRWEVEGGYVKRTA